MSKMEATPSEELTLFTRGYRLGKVLGEGSYAKVYLSEYKNANTNETVKNLACKVIDTSKAPKDFVKKFLPRELEIIGKLNHPHIIHVHSIFQRKNKFFIFMRCAENGDLLEFILKKGAVSEVQSRVWLRQLSLALQYLHEMEVAHRDLKCENALITSNYNLKLADFGFARFVTDGMGRKVTSETYCGSMSYAAPEILKGTPYYPKIADMWSLGVILYIMLNKAMPFDDHNIKRLYEQQVNRKWKVRSKIVDVLSQHVKKVLVHLLEPDQTKRWRIEQVIGSEWFLMDPKSTQLTAAEQAALVSAQEERKRYIESLNRKKSLDRIVRSRDDLTVLKYESKQNDEENKANQMSMPSVLTGAT